MFCLPNGFPAAASSELHWIHTLFSKRQMLSLDCCPWSIRHRALHKETPGTQHTASQKILTTLTADSHNSKVPHIDPPV